MAVMNPGKSIIRRKNLLPFHRLDFIRMIYKKSHTQANNLSSCHEMENNCVSLRNRTILEIICHLTPILQGGIAFFAVFRAMFRFSRNIARIKNKSVALPDLRRDSGFPKKSLILRTNLSSFHGVVRDRMISGKPYDSNCELMSSRCVGFICYVLRKIEYFVSQINVYYLCRV